MASIEPRVNSAGVTTSYRVIWRDAGRRRTRSFKSEHQAEQWRALLDLVGNDTNAAARAVIKAKSRKPSFESVAHAHMERLVNVQPATLRCYEGYLRAHTPMLNRLPVDQVHEDDLIRWIKSRVDAGLSPKTIKNVYGFVASVLSTAVALGHIEGAPRAAKYLPKHGDSRDATTFLTVPEFNALLAYIPEHYHLLMRFLLATGLRLSEAAALTPGDFDYSGATPVVRVSKAWKDTRTNGWVIGPPKTRKARRTVSMPPSVAIPLAEHLRTVKPGDLVFTMIRGSAVRSDRLHNRVWQKAVTRARAEGFPKKPRIHDLRHSHASLMLAQGMPLYELSVRLGHESTDTTTGTYSHLMPDAHFRGAEYAAKALAV